MTTREEATRLTGSSRNVLEQLNVNAAGLDIGAEEIYVCVPADRAEQPVRVFGTYTQDLYELAAWLRQCGVDTVALESTGVYWIPIYEILDAQGLEVYLINARHLRHVPGRKTDVADCQWLQQLHTYGLLRASFRPPEEICALRAVARHRANLIRYQAGHVQHMHKALQMMNVKLSQAVSDLTGATGLRIIRAILAGERDPLILAQLRDPKCAKSESEIAQALTGNYKAEHLFVLKQAVAQYDFYQTQLAECDVELEQMYGQLPQPAPSTDCPPPAPKKRKRRKNEAHFDLGVSLYRATAVDLTAVDGLDALSVQTIISEIGTDMSRWRTVKHFTSWLGVSPCPEKTGGKTLHTGTKKTQNRASLALRLAAQSVHHSHSAIGAFYRRMRVKLGPAEAITATAHKLARIVYHLLKYRTPYVDPGEDAYVRKHRDHVLRNLKQRAANLGFELVPAAPQAAVVS